MAGWLIPALKAMLPHVGDILTAAKPVLTRKRDVGPEVMQQQIAELQGAVSQQAAYIKDLAAQLENTVSALEKAAEIAEQRLRRMLWVTALAAAFSVAALGAALVAFIAR
jgi:hypothetical protein